MTLRFILILLISSFISRELLAQRTISGYVKSASTGEKLIGAHIIEQQTKQGAVADTDGYFVLQIADTSNLIVSFTGYQPDTIAILEHQHQYTILLKETLLDEVEVMGYNTSGNNATIITSRAIKETPTLGAVPDVIKTIQLSPGIVNQNEGSSHLLVRGGTPGQNMYLIDEIPLLYVNHLGGFLSVFNPDMINHLAFYKDAFPAMYGGKLSSIVSITQKEGNNKAFKGNFDIGLLSTALAVEGPLKLKNATYTFTARKTLIDGLMALGSSISEGNDFTVAYGFHDINGKLTWQKDPKNYFSLNIYQGDDYLNYWASNQTNKSRTGTIWGNWMLAGHWKYKPGSKLQGHNSISFVNYRLRNFSRFYEDNAVKTPTTNTEYRSVLAETRFQSNLKYYMAHKHLFQFGYHSSVFHHLPNAAASEANKSPSENSFLNSVYATQQWTFKPDINLRIGARLNTYTHQDYTEWDVSPRVYLSYGLKHSNTVNIGYAKVFQYNHLLYTTGSIANNELWIPGSKGAPRSYSRQISLGYEQAFYDNAYHFSLNTYYKTLDHLATYQEGTTSILGDSNWQNKISTNGSGSSRGVEFSAHKNSGTWKGTINYTLSRTDYQFPAINNGKKYQFEFDRTHVLNLSVNRKLSNKWHFTAGWTYQTGLPYTPAIGKQQIPDSEHPGNFKEVLIYGERNSDRLKDYHRLDLGFRYATQTKRGNKAIWNFSIYNAYNRQNAYNYYYHTNASGDFGLSILDNENVLKQYQISYFPIIPSFSYKVYFDGAIFKRKPKSKREKKRSNFFYFKE